MHVLRAASTICSTPNRPTGRLASTSPSFPQNVVKNLENKGFDAIRGPRAVPAKTPRNRPKIRRTGVTTPGP